MLESESRTLEVTGTITNLGDVAVPYQWLEHIALGPPLLGPEAQLEVPCETVRTDDSQADNARLPADESFAWLTFKRADTAVDLRCFPERDASVLDNALLADLTDRYYTVRNESVGLETTVRFDADRFDSLWYWGALGGYNHSPFFGRAYALRLEPCTSMTKAGLDKAIEEGTAEEIEPGETHRTTTSITVDSQ